MKFLEVYDEVVNSLCSVVLKLNDSAFRSTWHFFVRRLKSFFSDDITELQMANSFHILLHVIIIIAFRIQMVSILPMYVNMEILTEYDICFDLFRPNFV